MEPLKPETALPPYAPMPYFLFDIMVDGEYLNLLEISVYSLLRGKANQSQTSDKYVDKDGNVYVIYTVKKLAEKLHRSERRILDALNTLEKAELIKRDRRTGYQTANRIYIFTPSAEVTKTSYLRGDENVTTEVTKTSHLRCRKRHPNRLKEIDKRIDSVSASVSVSKINPTDPFVELAGDDEALLQALKDFQEMRNKSKHPLTSRAKKLICTELQKAPRTDWVAMLNQSVMNAWRGVFPLKQQPQSARPAEREYIEV